MHLYYSEGLRKRCHCVGSLFSYWYWWATSLYISNIWRIWGPVANMITITFSHNQTFCLSALISSKPCQWDNAHLSC